MQVPRGWWLAALVVASAVGTVRAQDGPDEATPTFSSVAWSLGGGHGLIRRTIAVEASGAVTVSLSSGFGSGMAELKTGQLRPQELARLREAVHAADFATIPNELPAPIPSPTDAAWGRFEVGQGGTTRVVRVPVAHILGPFTARLEPLVELLEGIAERVQHPARFEQVTLSTSVMMLGQKTELTVRADGRVSLRRVHPTTHFEPLDGAATPEELEALTDAVGAARLASIPSPLPVPVIMIVPDHPFAVEIQSQDEPLRGRVSGQVDAYGPWEARLRPLMAALEAISDRLTGRAPMREVSGTVRVRMGRVHLENGDGEWRVNDAEAARLLRRFDGHSASLRGRIDGTTLGEVVVLQPERREGWTVALAQGGRIALPGGAPVPVFGPAAPALRRAGVGPVLLDGWAFVRAGHPREVWVETVQASVVAAGTLQRSGHVVAEVVPGQQVMIERASRSHDFVQVRTADGTLGSIPLFKLDLARAAPGPLTAPAPTPGFSGAVDPDEH